MVYTVVKYDMTRRLREKGLGDEWKYVNEKTANNKIISCDNVI
jgi:hypothetical protein